MLRNTSIVIPTLVRIKPGALDRLGVYAKRNQFNNIVLFYSKELDAALIERVNQSMGRESIDVLQHIEISSSSFEHAEKIFQSLPHKTNAIIAFGGGKALDVAKYVAFLSRLPYIAVPTALSNDGFCSPQCSLDFQGKKRSLPAAMPYGVVIDTEVCLNAPKILWISGIGDLVSKITAVYDWKIAYKKKGTQLDDFSALLSDATVFQLMAKPDHDLEGMRLLGTALMLNGIAMEICGSSRPASGSEHLISHALDLISKKPHLHGIQVGTSTYIMSQLQGCRGTDRIAKVFDTIGFWDAVKADPFIRSEWLEAFKIAPTIKSDFYTILSEKDYTQDFIRILDNDSRLQGVFV
ncbi:MAG: iron-containing alcohol dehydrogenase family protein [Candidatus Omnitrophica bacterium]|nr:iron-containing alcohol dehydrogenase family protein [Candidatus Omnitrophota bacterium]